MRQSWMYDYTLFSQACICMIVQETRKYSTISILYHMTVFSQDCIYIIVVGDQQMFNTLHFVPPDWSAKDMSWELREGTGTWNKLCINECLLLKGDRTVIAVWGNSVWLGGHLALRVMRKGQSYDQQLHLRPKQSSKSLCKPSVLQGAAWSLIRQLHILYDQLFLLDNMIHSYRILTKTFTDRQRDHILAWNRWGHWRFLWEMSDLPCSMNGIG